MTIQTFSSLQNSGEYNLNSDTFDSRLLFTDTNAIIFYAMIRFENGTYTVIANGKLNGYNDGSADYQYKFDFNNYIKITQNREPVLTEISPSTLYKFSNLNTSTLSLVLSSTDILTSNTSDIVMSANGEYILDGAIPADLTYDIDCLDYLFLDKNSNVKTFLTSNSFVYNESFLNFTLYSGQTITIRSKDYTSFLLNTFTLTGASNSDVYLYYILPSATKIEYSINSGAFATIYPTLNTCNNQLFYYSIDGSFDNIYLEGNIHEVNNVKKEYVTIGNKKMPIKIITEKQLKCNTGFKLNQSQVYSLIKTPFVFLVDIVNQKVNRYILDTTTFEGYNGTLYNEKNIELLLTDEKQYKRKTNFDLDFWD